MGIRKALEDGFDKLSDGNNVGMNGAQYIYLSGG